MMVSAATNPKEFAYHYFEGPGYSAVVKGEVVHVAQYRTVSVEPRFLEKE
jgi:hypothetical protein